MSLIQTEIMPPVTTFVKPPLRDVDRVCSSYLQFENPKWIEIDGMYYASLLVIHYQREMEGLFLDALLTLDLDLQISMFYTKRPTYEVIKELTYRIGNTGASLRTSQENQQDIDIMGNTYQDAKYIRKQLQLGEEELFDISLYLGTFASSPEELEQNLQRMESIAIGVGLTTIRATFRQEEAFKTVMPFLQENAELQGLTARNVLSSGLVSTYPFVSNELYDKDGIFVGCNSFDQSLILLNRFDTNQYKNANMFVVGTSGSGKSYFVKLMLNRNRFLNIQQYVIDPDREYESICRKLGGTVLKFGTEQMMNVMEIHETVLEEGESYLRNKIGRLQVFFSLLFPEMTEEERAKLEECLLRCYQEKGITEDNASLYQIAPTSKVLQKQQFKTAKDMPLLGDVYKQLKKERDMKRYATMLKPYVTGNMKIFNQATNVNLKNRLVVIDIHEVEETYLPMVMFVVTDYVWDCIREDRSQKKILYLDEVWKMIQKNPYTADFVFRLFKTIRKYGGAATAITQDISDFFLLEEGKYGKGILNNSSIKCLFQMEENEIRLLEQVLVLSEEEKMRLINLPRGTALLHAGRNRLLADVVASEKEHQWITTDRMDLEKQNHLATEKS